MMIEQKRIADRIAQRVSERDRAARIHAENAERVAVTRELAAEDRLREARVERDRCERAAVVWADCVADLAAQITRAQADGRVGAAFELQIELNRCQGVLVESRDAARYAQLAAFNIENNIGPAEAWTDPNAGFEIRI